MRRSWGRPEQAPWYPILYTGKSMRPRHEDDWGGGNSVTFADAHGITGSIRRHAGGPRHRGWDDDHRRRGGTVVARRADARGDGRGPLDRRVGGAFGTRGGVARGCRA